MDVRVLQQDVAVNLHAVTRAVDVEASSCPATVPADASINGWRVHPVDLHILDQRSRHSGVDEEPPVVGRTLAKTVANRDVVGCDYNLAAEAPVLDNRAGGTDRVNGIGIRRQN